MRRSTKPAPQTEANARTWAWTRLRKLVGVPASSSRRLILQEACDEIERLRSAEEPRAQGEADV